MSSRHRTGRRMPRLRKQTLKLAQMVEAIYEMDEQLTPTEQHEAVKALSGMNRREMAKFVSKYFQRDSFVGLDRDIARGIREGRPRLSSQQPVQHKRTTYRRYTSRRR